jgi:hypothetical protein
MNEYECVRCNYRSNKKSSIINHLNKVKKCDKNIDSMKYTNDEIFKISTTKLKDRVKSETFCNFCEKNYCNIYVLEKHKLKCKKKDINEKLNEISNEISNETPNIITNNYSINANNINNNNINNSNNNNNVYIFNLLNNNEDKKPTGFDEEWKTDHINILTKLGIIMSNYSFHELLNQILLNKDNLNVILDNNQDKGYIYHSDNKYKEMNTSEIIDRSMKKLLENSLKIKDELISSDRFPTNLVRINYNHIKEKYDDFCQDDKTKNNFEGSLKEIFLNKKNESLDIYHKLKNNNNNVDKIC